MFFLNPVSSHRVVSGPSVIAHCFAIGTVAMFGVATWALVAAEEPKVEKPKPMTLSGAGEFVSYKDGKLVLRGRGGAMVWNNVGKGFKSFQRDEDGRASKPVDTAEALSKLTTGMAVRVNVEKTEIYFGADEQTHGTFVSYKDGKLTLIGRAEELGPSFTKKYGTNLSPQIDPKTPVFESIDGDEFRPIGTAEALSSVKEGTIVTLRGVNDNVNLIQIGMPKKKLQKETVDQKEMHGFGRFISFKDGTLTLESNAHNLIVWHNISATTKTFKFDSEAGEYKLVDSSIDALSHVKAGSYVMVGDRRAFIRIGARVDKVKGSFVSFKDDRLLTLGKDLPESFTKRYGNSLHYNKFRDDVPVYESVDGEAYKLLGTANKVLGEVKEGTLLTVHGEGDDNITLIQLGVPTEK